MPDNKEMPLKTVVVVAPDIETAEGFSRFLIRVSLVMGAVSDFASTVASIDEKKGETEQNAEGTAAVDRLLKAIVTAYPGESGGDMMSADVLSLDLISSMMPMVNSQFSTGRKDGH